MLREKLYDWKENFVDTGTTQKCHRDHAESDYFETRKRNWFPPSLVFCLSAAERMRPNTFWQMYPINQEMWQSTKWFPASETKMWNWRTTRKLFASILFLLPNNKNKYDMFLGERNIFSFYCILLFDVGVCHWIDSIEPVTGGDAACVWYCGQTK